MATKNPKRSYKLRGRPEKNRRTLRIERMRAAGIYPTDEQRAAQRRAAGVVE